MSSAAVDIIFEYVILGVYIRGGNKEHPRHLGTFVRKRLGSAQWEAKSQ
jgi:hypothetical protein